MQNFKGRVAVVTGAASDIGFGLAERFGAEGKNLVLADVEEPALIHAADTLRSAGVEVVAVRCDVAHAEDVERLVARTLEAFGGVHIVCNNAGVGDNSGASLWDTSLEDWSHPPWAPTA